MQLEKERVIPVTHYSSDQELHADTCVTDSFWIPVSRDVEKQSLAHRRETWTHASYKHKPERDVKESEKQWQLQRKVFDLNAQMSQLEKRVTNLREENDVLKRKSEEQKVSEEKMKQLKKRNAELASIARRLEEKVKQFQHETSLKKTKEFNSSLAMHQDSSQKQLSRSKMKEQQTDYTKILADKDQAIERLREKCQELLRQFQSSQDEQQRLEEMRVDSVQYESMLRQAIKERLQLEKRIVQQNHSASIEAEQLLCKSLEQENQRLTNEVQRLTESLHDMEKLEVEVVQRRIQVESLESQLTEAHDKCSSIDQEMQRLSESNTQLTILNCDLQQRATALEKMSNDYEDLESRLRTAEADKQCSEAEVLSLKDCVKTLQAELEYMQKVEQKKRVLEAEKENILELVRVKQLELENIVQAKKIEDEGHQQALEAAQQRLMESEAKFDEQTLRQRLIEEEMLRLQQDLQQALHGRLPTSEDKKIHAAEANNVAFRDRQNNKLQVVNSKKKSESSSQLEVKSEMDVIGDDLRALLQVYQAVCSYEPNVIQETNNQQLEYRSELLPINSGDYVFVCGEMDEEGYYYGELMDGNRGLVSADLLRQLSENEQSDFYSAVGLASQLDNDCEYLPVGSLDAMYVNDTTVNESSSADRLANQSSSADRLANQSSSADRLANQSSSADRLANQSADVLSDLSLLQSPDKSLPGVPEAPVNVQLEAGPDLGSLMVSWLPVTLITTGRSNGLQVAGYAVYVDGRLVKQLLNPTGDHVLVECHDLSRLQNPHSVTVRTFSVDGKQSADSQSEILPVHLMQEILHQPITSLPVNQASSIQTKDEDTDLDHVQQVLPDRRLSYDSLITKTSSYICEEGQCGKGVAVTSSSLQEEELTGKGGAVAAATVPHKNTSHLTVHNTHHHLLLPDKMHRTVEVVDELFEDDDDKDACSVVTDSSLISFSSTDTIKQLSSVHNADKNRTVQCSDSVQSVHKPADMLAQYSDSVQSVHKPAESKQRANVSSVNLMSSQVVDAGDEQLNSPVFVNASPILLRHEDIDRNDDISVTLIAHQDVKSLRNNSKQFIDDQRNEEIRQAVDSSRQEPNSCQDDIGIYMNTYSSSNVNGDLSTNISKTTSKETLCLHDLSVQKTDSSVRLNSSNRNSLVKDDSLMNDIATSGMSNGALTVSSSRDDVANATNSILDESISTSTLFPLLDRSTKLSQDVQWSSNSLFRPVQGKTTIGVSSEFGSRTLYDPSCDVTLNEPAREPTPELLNNNMLTTRFIRDDISDSDLIDYSDDGGESLVESVATGEGLAKIRLFISLFMYDPSTMSPNPDAANEELPFAEGQIIKIYGEKDDDGFYVGEANGRRGLVPCNMISEIHVDDPDIAAQLLKETNHRQTHLNTLSNQSLSSSRATSHTSDFISRSQSAYSANENDTHDETASPTEDEEDLEDEERIRYMVALYSYNPIELSPNIDAEEELSFNKGDIIEIYGDMDDDGFYYGSVNGQRGLVPSNFLQERPLSSSQLRPAAGHARHA